MNIKITSSLLIAFIIGFTSTLSVNAQSYNVQNLNDYFETQKISKSSSIDSELQSLIYDVNPTIYIENGEVQSFGDGLPTVVELDFQDWETLKADKDYYNSIRLLKIKYSDNNLNKSVDLSQLKSFENLDYIFIQCTFNCSPAALKQLFQNTDISTVFYLNTITE